MIDSENIFDLMSLKEYRQNITVILREVVSVIKPTIIIKM